MMNSFKSYGKVNAVELENLAARQRTRRRIIIITLSSIALVGIILGAVLGTTLNSNGNKNDKASTQGSISSSVKAVCSVTLYPDSCVDSLSQAQDSSSLSDPDKLSKLTIGVALQELERVSESFFKDLSRGVSGNFSTQALNNCEELLGLAIDSLNTTLTENQGGSLVDVVDDVRTSLSAAGTYQDTCMDGFEDVSGDTKSLVSAYLKNSTEFTSNSLAIITGLSNLANSLNLRRRLLSTQSASEMPIWLTRVDRKLLQSSNVKPKPNLIVAQDGTGNYKTIGAALKAVPEKSNKWFVIYVKKGVYFENVRVEKPKWNVFMYGDGMDKTIVSARLNVIDGTPTFSTATFAVFGKGFIGIDMAFRNTAGAQKHQAVALMASADQAVFFRCRIDAFQDSLYTHAQRQFYRECEVYGTVDFIFGNAAVVLQNCAILPRVPMTGQQNTITAQGKVDPNQNTGIVIQNCNIKPFGNLGAVRTYLGRPWKDYSTTIFMQSTLGGLIHPDGWMPWIGTSAPSTIFYSEFQNVGSGSSTKNRVKWKGLRTITVKDANRFTVKSFIWGDSWISGAGVTYKSGL